MSRRRWSLLVPLAVAAACGGPQAPWSEAPAVSLDLRASVRPTTVGLLQPVTVELHLFRRPDLPVEFAPTVAGEDFLVETRVGTEREFGHGLWQTTTLVLRPKRPGELLLPSFAAKAKDGTVAASTPEQPITVTSTLDGQAEAIEAPGEPFLPPMRWWPWAAGAGVLVLLAAAVWWLRRRRRPAALPFETALPPHVKAQRALARLRGAPRTTPAQIEAFYVEVSQVLRVYVEERFGLHAPERTTEEFLRELESGAALVREHRAELERFLSQCDLVKFAALVPTEADHLATFALAEAFVDRTRADRSETPRAAAAPTATAGAGA